MILNKTLPPIPAARRIALAEQLLATAAVLTKVLSGISLTTALADPSAKLRPGVLALSAHTLRHLGTLQAVLHRLLPQRPKVQQLDDLLTVALGLLPDTGLSGGPSYTAHTVVDQAVDAAARLPALRRFKAVVNAVLREALRQPDLWRQVKSHARAQWNYPAWWVERLQQAYPDCWETLLQMGKTAPPLTLRVNVRRAQPDQVLAAFTTAGIAAQVCGPSAIRVMQAQPIETLPGFQEGHWSVQDLGAQYAAPLLDAMPGMRVLDACAAPGGKTAHLLESCALDLVAVDVDATRLSRVAENLSRLGLSAQLVASDLAAYLRAQPTLHFDRILLDVPCSASGIVRRHPDICWLRRPGDLPDVVQQQRQLLDVAWAALKPGGKLLYATCAIFPEEGVIQAAAFAERHVDAQSLPAPGQLLPSLTHDGFFYALFEKRQLAQSS